MRERSSEERGGKAAMTCSAVLRPCRRRAEIWSRTAAGTGAPRCREHREAPRSRKLCPWPEGRQGTSPSRGCEGGGMWTDGRRNGQNNAKCYCDKKTTLCSDFLMAWIQ